MYVAPRTQRAQARLHRAARRSRGLRALGDTATIEPITGGRVSASSVVPTPEPPTPPPPCPDCPACPPPTLCPPPTVCPPATVCPACPTQPTVSQVAKVLGMDQPGGMLDFASAKRLLQSLRGKPGLWSYLSGLGDMRQVRRRWHTLRGLGDMRQIRRRWHTLRGMGDTAYIDPMTGARVSQSSPVGLDANNPAASGTATPPVVQSMIRYTPYPYNDGGYLVFQTGNSGLVPSAADIAAQQAAANADTTSTDFITTATNWLQSIPAWGWGAAGLGAVLLFRNNGQVRGRR